MGQMGNDYLAGEDGDDQIFGGDGHDILTGQRGNDRLEGGKGDDSLMGGDGNDQLFGEAGNDVLHGGTGADLLNGGLGIDTFLYTALNESNLASGVDVIQGFEIWDRIDVSAIDAMPQFAGDQAFLFISGGFLPGLPGQLRSYISGGNTFVEAEVTGDGVQDFMLMIQGAHALTGLNFIL
jgi:Ca2+-binding RTX toxin-like protein